MYHFRKTQYIFPYTFQRCGFRGKSRDIDSLPGILVFVTTDIDIGETDMLQI
jgi:hypothetical protein